MNKNFILSVILLISLSNIFVVFSQQTIGLDAVASVSVDGDVIRAYTYIESNLINPSFTLTGLSVGGSLLNKTSSLSVDTSIFKLTTDNLANKVAPTYFFNFNNFDSTAGQGGATVSASNVNSFFMPTFIVEYEETNNVEGFQYGGDTILGFVNLAKLDYSVSHVEKQLTLKGTDKTFKAYQVTLTSKTNLFQMVFYVSGAPVELGGNRLSAEQSKVDILINKYYDSTVNPSTCSINGGVLASCTSTGASSNANSRLALTSFYAASKFDIDLSASASGGGSIQLAGSDIGAGFSWISTADVSASSGNGVATVKVVANTTATGNDGDVFGAANINGQLSGQISSQFLTFSFVGEGAGVRPSAVLWDPVIGSGAAESNSASTLIYSFGLIMSIVLSITLFL